MVKSYQFLLLGLVAIAHGAMVRKNSPRLSEKDEALAYETAKSHNYMAANDSVTILGVNGTSGLVNVTSDGSAMFYWFIEKLGGNVTTDTIPIILWLQGGPGCSSFSGALFEFGPIYIDDNLNPQLRNVTWGSSYHLLFIDNPLGAGYSSAVNNSDYVISETQMAANLYSTIVQLYQRYPAWLNHDLYIFGESYAGKYIPAVTTKILSANKQKPAVVVPLRGIGIGDGWTDPVIQNTRYGSYAFSAGLIDEAELAVVDDLQDQTVGAILNEDYGLAGQYSDSIVAFIQEVAGGINEYNVRVFGEYNTTAMDTWLSLNSTKQMFHVPNATQYSDCSAEAGLYLNNEVQASVKYMLPNILSQLKVLLYNAQDDLIVNTPGADAWIQSIPWRGQGGFLDAPRQVWQVQGQVAGYAKNYTNLHQVLVNDAGHLSPMDQTANTLDMVNRFVYNLGWSS